MPLPQLPSERRKAIQVILGVLPDSVFGGETRAAFQALAVAKDPPAPPETIDNLIPLVAPEKGEPVDARSEGNISTLHPQLQPIARELIRKSLQAGIGAKVISGTRSYAEQGVLRQRYLAGGQKAAPSGWSNHNFGLAFDVGIFVDGQYIDDAKGFPAATMERLYRTVGAIGKSLGLFWGGDWDGRDQDPPHFELRPPWAHSMNETAMLTELRRRHEAHMDALA